MLFGFIRINWFVLPVLWLLCSWLSTGQATGADFGTLHGHVRDTEGTGIAGVQVASDFAGTHTVEDGYYIMFHTAGSISLTALAAGYAPVTLGGIEVLPGGDSEVDFTLQAVPLILENAYPRLIEIGNEARVELTGEGFSSGTRLFMYPDVGNRKYIVGETDGLSSSRKVHVDGRYAYIAAGLEGFYILDISDPMYPKGLGSMENLGMTNQVVVKDGYAYVASRVRGLHVIDVSDPGVPEWKTTWPAGDRAMWVAIQDHYAYIADNSAGVQIIDIQDPEHPALVKTIDTPGNALCTCISGNLLLVADAYRGLCLIDVQDPYNPRFVQTLDCTEEADSVIAIGNTAYLAAGSDGLQVINISSPEAPFLVRSIDTPGIASQASMLDDTAYVADGQTGLVVIDLSAPDGREIVGTVSLSGSAAGLHVGPDYAYVTDDSEGLKIIDVREGFASTLIERLETPGQAWKLALDGSVLYVADQTGGVRVMDVSSPGHLMEIAHIPVSWAADIAVEGDYAYITDITGSFSIYDITAPSSPTPEGTIPLPGNPQEFVLDGRYAYVAAGSGGLCIIDVSDSSHPIIVEQASFAGNATDVRLRNGYAYVTNDYWGLWIIDVRDPDSARPVGAYTDTGRRMLGCALYNDYMFVAGGEKGVLVFSLADPVTPVLIREVDVGGWAQDVTIKDGYAYVSDNKGGVRILDVRLPFRPVLTGSLETIGSSSDVIASGDLAYVADGAAGISVLSLPVEITDIQFEDENRLSFQLPDPGVSGHFTLRAANSNQSVEIAGAVTFVEILPVSKAVIVTGYGPHASNWLWEETKRCANQAYNALLFQGYTKENILYISQENIDVDGNGKFDDIDLTDVSEANIEYALTEWVNDVGAPADDLIVYMVGHGLQHSFTLTQFDNGSETVYSNSLKEYLNSLKPDMPGKSLFLYDACYSGSFLEDFAYPAGLDLDRVVMTSSMSGEKAKFKEFGRLSFSYQFWTAVFEGAPLVSAFNHAYRMMADVQTAWLDADGNGIPNEDTDNISGLRIGRGFKTAPSELSIGSFIEDHTISGTNSLNIWIADVQPQQTITRAWAVVIPPDYDPGSPDAPDELPIVEMSDPDGDGTYERTYDGFIRPGAYTVVFYAADDAQNLSFPVSAMVFKEGEPADLAAEFGLSACPLCFFDTDGDMDVDGTDLHSFIQDL